MAKAKYQIPVQGNLYAVVTIDISFPKNMEMVADALGYGKEERDNLCNQKLNEVIQLLGGEES